MKVTIQKWALAATVVPVLAMSQAMAADAPKAGAMAAPAGSVAAASMREMRASKLIGSDVRNEQKEDLGDIKDLIIDVSNHRIHYAIISFGGFLGMGDKLFAFPVSAFRQVGNDDEVVLNVDKARLKAAPGFDSKEFPDFNTAKYRAQVDKYFKSSPAVKPMKNQLLMRASEWMGKDINDRNGKDVGEVEDLVVNMGSGKIHYAIVEFDKSWSLDDKLLAVPMQALHYKAESKDLVWDIDKARLDTKAAFDKNNWPDINDPKTMSDIDRTLIILVPTTADNAASQKKGQK